MNLKEEQSPPFILYQKTNAQAIQGSLSYKDSYLHKAWYLKYNDHKVSFIHFYILVFLDFS